jgi:membrane-associated protease RseP (regulator of RpoE activity)
MSITDPLIEEAMEELFDIKEKYFNLDIPTFIIDSRDNSDSIKHSFKELVNRIKPLGYLPLLNEDNGSYNISLFKRRKESEKTNRKNKILFFATLITVFFDGYLRSNTPVLTEVLMKDTPSWMNALIFTMGIISIFGLHEMGHKIVSIIRGMDSSMPYFIPGPPGMGGTFGAVITQRDPPVNKDDLFDLGISGPLFGFLATLIVGAIGLKLSFTVPQIMLEQMLNQFPEISFQSISFPWIMNILSSWIKPTPSDMVLIIHPVAFAAWVGCLITFLNLIPAWQLDGGHIFRSLLGEDIHRKVSVIGVLILALSGFWLMAVLIFVFMMMSQGEQVELLDEISPLSKSRKAGILLYIALVALTLTNFSFLI